MKLKNVQRNRTIPTNKKLAGQRGRGFDLRGYRTASETSVTQIDELVRKQVKAVMNGQQIRKNSGFLFLI